MSKSNIDMQLTPTERTVLVDQVPLPPGITARLRFAVRTGAHYELSFNAEEFDALMRAMVRVLDETADNALSDVIAGIFSRIKPVPTGDIPEEFDRSAFPSDLPDHVCQEIHTLLRSGRYESMEEAFEAVQQLVESHNYQPLDTLLGLTPDQVYRLLFNGWNGPESLIQIQEDMTAEELAESMYCRNAGIVLRLLEDEGGAVLTPKKNINRKWLKKMFEHLDWPRYQTDHTVGEISFTSERQCTPVHNIRILLEAARMVRVYKGKLLVSKRGRHFLDPARAGELQAELFITLATKFNLAYFDGAPDYPGVQDTYAFILYALSRVAREPVGVSIACEAAFLPDVAVDFMEFEYFSHKDFVFHTRVLRPLRDFGLIVWSPEILDRMDEDAEQIVHTTPLFDRMIHFELEAPPAATK